MKKYLILLLLPLFVLSCSRGDVNELMEDPIIKEKIKDDIMLDWDIIEMEEFEAIPEVGTFENSKVYKYLYNGSILLIANGRLNPLPEMIEKKRALHTKTMYNCYCKFIIDKDLVKYNCSYNSNAEFIIQYASSEMIRVNINTIEELKKSLKIHEKYSTAFDYHYFRRGVDVPFNKTSLYDYYDGKISEYQTWLENHKDLPTTDPMVIKKKDEKSQWEQTKRNAELEFIRSAMYYVFNFYLNSATKGKILYEGYFSNATNNQREYSFIGAYEITN